MERRGTRTLGERHRRESVLGGFPAAVLVLALLLGLAAAVRAAAAPASSSDPLGRETPRSAMRGYLVACRSGDYATAARYLDLHRLPPAKRAEAGPRLARQLKVVLDRTLWVDLEALSDHPAGDTQDGLPPRRERVGTIASAKGPVAIDLERSRANGLWRISAATVARIPALYEEFGYGRLGDWLPAPFFELRLLEIELWQWIGLLTLVLLAAGASWFAAVGLVRVIRPLIARTRTTFDDRLLEATVAPLRLLVAVALFSVGSLALGLSVPAQRFFAALEKVLVILAVTWLVFRVVDVLSHWASDRLTARGQAAVIGMLPLGRRAVKAVIGTFAVIALLQNLGVNVTGLLAGLGVGGLAVALAAQKTIENLFGGLTVITDQPVRVGDFCRFGDKIGTVEDIGLRSTRIRTLDRTVVSIPNAEFAQLQLENFARRDKIWYHPRIGLRYETTPDQIRYVLVEIRRMLYAHPKVDPDPARVRFVGFGSSSLDIDIFAYVLATDYSEFLEIAEDLNLRIMDIVERAGTGFAFPSQTVYVAQDGGLDERRGREAQDQVGRWRERGELCLPKFPPETIESLRGTIDYPPPGSAVRGPA